MRLIYIPKPVSAFFQAKYGRLYNWYAGVDARNIANTGWHVPTTAEHGTLVTYLGGGTVAGGHLKETGTTYWNSPNTGADNSSKFNFRGSGDRSGLGVFENIKIQGYIWASTQAISTTGNYLSCFYINISTSGHPGSGASLDKKRGHGLRLVKDSTTLTNGQSGTYIGNDGKIYRTIAIGSPAKEWLADNLAETKYRNGDSIPIVTDNTAWAALTTGAMCSYNNDDNNI